MKKRIREIIYFLCFIIALTVFTGRLIYLQVFSSKENISKRVSKYTIKAKRGSIITNDNFEIALDLEYFKIEVDPTKFLDDESLLSFLKILKNNISNFDYNKALSEIKERKNKNKRNYDFNKLILQNTTVEKIKDEMVLNKLNEKLVYFSKFYKRNYIDNNIFETIVGYLNNENEGVYGLEKYYNEYLTGKDGEYEGFRPFSEKLAEYTLPYLIGKKEIKKKVDGYNLKLSLNSIMQYALDEALEKVFIDYEPVIVMGIVMESDTGKILAMDSYPKAKNRSEIKNHNIANLFEPGSIFKPITVAAAINDGKINENTLISSEGFIKVKNRIVRDHDSSTKGILPVSKIIAHSGNVGLVKISQLLDPVIFYEYISKFNFGKKQKIDSSYEISNKLLTFKDFTEVRRSNISFGQGINVTQLQMLTALNATINGGKILKPQLVDEIVDENNNSIKKFETEIVKRPISEDTSYKIRKMLKQVVETGTGKGAIIPGYVIGGKTGTAQKAGEKGYEYGKYFSSFFAFFPADNPKYSILITVDEPKGAYYGATVALPAAKEMLEKIIKYKNIEPTEEIKDENSKEVVIGDKKKVLSYEEINKNIEENIMPDLTGVTKKVILESKLSEYNIKFEGSGKVIYQNIEVGNTIDKNVKILLKLE